jgi:transcription elongation factor Elf1
MADSQQRMKQWREEESSERDTLVTCPACKGNGKVMLEGTRSYRLVPCKWCGGVTGVTKDIHAKFRRWMRIAGHAKANGRCPS